MVCPFSYWLFNPHDVLGNHGLEGKKVKVVRAQTRNQSTSNDGMSTQELGLEEQKIGF
jgi:hypothetical protein